MKTAFIYALCEPGTRKIRYIGKTTNLKRRFSQHLNESPKRKSHLGCWLRSLLMRGEQPRMVILCEISDQDWPEAEINYISLARELGVDLVNDCDGGVGGRGRIFSEAHRAAISKAKTGTSFSVQHKINHSVAMAKLAGPNSPSFGKSRTSEQKLAHSKAMSGENHWCFGTQLSRTTRDKISAAHVGMKHSEETRAKLRAAWVIRKARKKAI